MRHPDNDAERRACDSMIRYIVSLLVELPHFELVAIMGQARLAHERERRRAEQRAGGSTDAARL